MDNRRNISTSHGQIFDYWKNKYINKNGEVSDTYEEDSVQVVKDWAEPECWCCGDFCEEVYNYRDYDRDIKEDVKRVWNYGCVKSKLERCHIIPFSLGGTDAPDNLFLMCPTCHKESPDIVKPDLLLVCFVTSIIIHIVFARCNVCKKHLTRIWGDCCPHCGANVKGKL